MAELKLPVAIGPIAIFRKGPVELTIKWVDGHHAGFSYQFLRSKCPCASCGTKPSHPVKQPAPGMLPMMPVLAQGAAGPADILSLEPIGRYAVSFTFGDGHSTGIYSFEYLRSICPCEGCEAKRNQP